MRSRLDWTWMAVTCQSAAQVAMESEAPPVHEDCSSEMSPLRPSVSVWIVAMRVRVRAAVSATARVSTEKTGMAEAFREGAEALC